MTTADDFDSDSVLGHVLRAGSAEFAAHLAPAPVAAVRARGDRRRRRRAAAGTALAVALVTVIGGGAIAGVAHVVRPTTVSPPADVAPAPASATSETAKAKAKSTGSGCTSLVVPQSEKDAVTAAYRRTQHDLVHIQPKPGGFYYGRCGTTYYAATSFDPTAGATLQEQVQLQDDGAAVKYFTKSPGGQWTFLASDGFPRDPRGCAAIKQIPSALAADWADCLQQH
jgi:hypothetical protein